LELELMVISGKTASYCLERLGFCPAPLSSAPFSDDFDSDLVSIEQVLEWARQGERQAKLERLSWTDLRNVISVHPAVLILRNGNAVLALRNRDSADEIIVADPLYENGEEFFLPRSLLEDVWQGDAIVSRAVPVQKKYKRGLLIFGSAVCAATLSIGLVFTETDAHRVVHSFVGLARLVTSKGGGSDHIENRSNTKTIEAAARLSPNGPDPSTASPTASPTADLDTQAGFEAGMSSAAVIEPGSIGTDSARPNSEPPAAVSSTSNAEMQPDNTSVPLAPTPQDNGLDTATAMPIGESDPGPSSAAAGSVSKSTIEVGSETIVLRPNPKVPGHYMGGSTIASRGDSTTTATPGSAAFRAVETTALINRGDALMASGDLTSARQFYERAADAGDGRAALRMGETYDPTFLTQSRLSANRGNALSAAQWYLRAVELGETDAAILFKAVVTESRRAEP
jgi:hypothetical protein